MRRPRLDDRLAPYLRDTPRSSRLLDQSRALTPFPTLERLLRPALADASRVLEELRQLLVARAAVVALRDVALGQPDRDARGGCARRPDHRVGAGGPRRR